MTFKPHSWKEYGDRVATPGTPTRQLADYIRDNKSVPMTVVRYQYISYGCCDGFDDEQITTALGSVLKNLYIYGAIKIENNRVKWIG
jgi:hypothetical protein